MSSLAEVIGFRSFSTTFFSFLAPFIFGFFASAPLSFSLFRFFLPSSLASTFTGSAATGSSSSSELVTSLIFAISLSDSSSESSLSGSNDGSTSLHKLPVILIGPSPLTSLKAVGGLQQIASRLTEQFPLIFKLHKVPEILLSL